MYNKTLLGLRLRILRDKLNLKQEDVADKIGCHRGAISNLERGAKAPSIDMLFSLSKFFDVSVDYLLGISDEPKLTPRSEEEQIINSLDLLSEGNGRKYRGNDQAIKKSVKDDVEKLIEGLDEESMEELHKFIRYLQARQTLSPSNDESSAGLEIKNK